MEDLARQVLSLDALELVERHASDLPLIFALWRQYYSTMPEVVAIAFARIIEAIPLSHDYAVQCLAHNTTYLRAISASQDENAAIELLICAWRLLRSDARLYIDSIDAAELWPLLQHSSRYIRFLTIQVLAYYTQAGDAVVTKMVQDSVGEAALSLRLDGSTVIDLHIFEVEEGRRITKIRAAYQGSRTLITDKTCELPAGVVRIGDIILPQIAAKRTKPSSIVSTSTTIENLNGLARALQSSDNVLLQGESGSGKTFLIEEVAKILGKSHDLVRIHLGDQTDAKLLLGTYVTAATPGEFTWQEGVLTKAVRMGKWLLFEDIDKAPSDVLSTLLPLLEHKQLLIPSRDQTIHAGPGFKIIATKTTDAASKWNITRLIGGRLWSMVRISILPIEELRVVITTRYPVLQNMAQTIMTTYESIITLLQTSHGKLFRLASARRVGTLDLMKWCRRIQNVYSLNSILDANQPISQNVSDDIFSEAVDCFAAAFATEEPRRLVVEAIGRSLAVPPERVRLYLLSHTPNHRDAEAFLSVGRASISKMEHSSKSKRRSRPFAVTAHASRLLEQLIVSTNLKESVLLVGETGTGKTTIIQQLADTIGQNLVAINMSQQTESGDLLGGYKPIDSKSLAIPLLESFERLFERTLSASKNARFLSEIRKAFNRGSWNRFVVLLKEAVAIASRKVASKESEHTLENASANGRKKRKHNEDLQQSWAEFERHLTSFEVQQGKSATSFTFAFVEGTLIRAVKNGDWVLLDEVNLAAADTLESINSLLQDEGSIILSEKGDIDPITPHPNFRLFACMNPATDVGKRDLPSGIRSRFTELYVQSPDTNIQDLLSIIQKYIGGLALEDDKACSDVAHLYLTTKRMTAENRLVDGANQKPHYSVRTLSRTLSYVADICPIYGLRRSLFEGFSMSFLTLLDRPSEETLRPVIEEYTILRVRNYKSLISQIPRQPSGNAWVQFKHYWLPQGPLQPIEDQRYIMTASVEKNMLNLVRAAATRKYPILLQGPTSSGKTSMIEYLANRTGHKFVRINNHEHTDLQEYLGSYVSDVHGNLVYQEGILVQAVRNGYWLVLDELNLAPTDVLEALNRLLDDNRELLIPETQELVRPSPSFVLFATQNPAGLYGGRKHLSRAFRNRFLELHFEDIPEDELETILCQRCQVAPTYCKRIVDVYKQLALRRQTSRVFEQKHSFVTLRDLFRWANRPAVGYEELAINGYLLLAERVRRDDEKLTVREVIEKVMKVSLEEVSSYDLDSLDEYQQLIKTGTSQDIVWTRAMRRLFVLILLSFRNNEPVLLVGETGCGKTTVCQMVADALSLSLSTLNAHQNTETADLIGAQRPIRDKHEQSIELMKDIAKFTESFAVPQNLPSDYTTADIEHILAQLSRTLEADASRGEFMAQIQSFRDRLSHMKALFEWSDGPLVQAMRTGEVFLLDEISLAEDSVLERLNSVLESGRTIVLAEKGIQDSSIVANANFKFCATMNPGGDFGKKELSPALRNRFTEIWVPALSEDEDILQILRSTLATDRRLFAPQMLAFARFFCNRFATALTSSVVSIRDLLTWCKFCNIKTLSAPDALIHGASMVYIDALGLGVQGFGRDEAQLLQERRSECVDMLTELFGFHCNQTYNTRHQLSITETHVAIGPFAVLKGPNSIPKPIFHLEAPTTFINATRILRAMQLSKPILLEGSPGVGKTSLVSAIAALSHRELVRINFSDQTDLMDLFGSDAPKEDSDVLEFGWRDAPFLQAMQSGAWVLLDEMNLAAQSILEGLNATLDHRGEAFIPELNRTFKCHPDFKVFAAQNPHSQGGGRKGLPKSFVNRFTVVYCDPLAVDDIKEACQQVMPNMPSLLIAQAVEFMSHFQQKVLHDNNLARAGGPFEFNLRDILRWLALLQDPQDQGHLPYFANFILRQRLRTDSDRAAADQMLLTTFGQHAILRPTYSKITPQFLTMGRTTHLRDVVLLPSSLPFTGIPISKHEAAEALLLAIRHAWPCILVGESGCGKSSLVRNISCLLGQDLTTIAMNNDMDASDLLGSFEQRDAMRGASTIFLKVSELLRWSLRHDPFHISTPMCIELLQSICTGNYDIALVKKTLVLLRELILPDSSNLVAELENLLVALGDRSIGKFQWSDGALVRAVRAGRWIVLDNANLCNPSVLDRLNSLLEPGGQLIVNERILSDGSPMVIKPHANFRLFLTMNHNHGELSRAMRNRCLEVFLPSTPQQESALHVKATNSDIDFWSSTMSAVSIPTDSTVTQESHIKALLAYFPERDITRRQFADVDQAQTAIFGRSFDILHNEVIPLLQSPSNEATSWGLSPRQVCSYEDIIAQIKKNNLSADNAISRALTANLWQCAQFRLSGQLSKNISQELSILQQAGVWLLSCNFLSYEQAAGVYSFLHFFVARLSFSELPFEMLVATMRRLQCFAADLDTSKKQSHQFASLFSQSKLLDKLTSGVHMEILWNASIRPYPRTEASFNLYRTAQHMLHILDRHLESKETHSHEATGLQLQYLTTLQDITQLESVDTGILPDALAIDESSTPLHISTQSSLVDAFQHILEAVELSSASRFVSWKDKISPMLRDILRLITLSRNRTVDVLDFLSPLQSSIFKSTARFSAIVATTLNTISGGTRMVATGKRTCFVNVWHEAILSARNARLETYDASRISMKELADQVSRHSESLLTSREAAMCRLICQKIVFLLCDLKVISEEESESMNINDYHESALGAFCERLHGLATTQCAIDSTLLPGSLFEAIRSVNAAACVPSKSVSASSRAASVGKAWIYLAMSFLIMYVPNVPLDPAAESRLRHEFEHWSVENAISIRDAHVHVQKAFVGGGTTYKLLSLDNDILTAQKSISNDAAIRPLRPATSRMQQLQAEFDHCLSTIHSEGDISSLLLLHTEQSHSFVPQCEAFLKTWMQFEKRMRQYDDYQDIVQPILEAMIQIKVGLQMMISEFQPAENDVEKFKTGVVNMVNPFNLIDVATSESPVSAHIQINGTRTCLQALVVLSVRQRLSGTHKSDMNLVQLVCEKLFQQWFVSRNEAEQRLLQDTNLFKYSAPEETSADDYRELFPDYEEQASANARQMLNSELTERDAIHAHRNVIDAIFSDSTTSDQSPSVSSVLIHAQQSLQFSFQDTNQSEDISASSLASYLYLADHELGSLEQDQITVQNYDFYRSPNVAEIKQILPVVQGLVNRVSTIAEAWPENSVLIEIVEALKRILDLTILAPIAQVLTMLEQTFGLLAQWQEVASTEFSITELFEAVRAQIVAWRRYELKCWPQLFTLEEAAASTADSKIWYNLYEVMVFVPAQSSTSMSYSNLHDSVQSLIQFLKSASIAQFRQRLEFLKTMQRHIQLLDTNEASRNLSHAARMIIQYFASFMPQVEKALAQERKVLTKEVNDVIRLASWRDTNVYALRESARRSHRTLYKIVHKYRRVLNKPVQDVLDVGMTDILVARNTSTPFQRQTFDLREAHRKFLVDKSLDIVRPARYAEPSRTALRLENIATSGPLSACDNLLGAFVVEVVDAIKQLRMETPSEYNKDEVKVVNHLKSRKYKLMSDSFKALKGFGLRSVIRPDDLQRQHNIEAIFLTNESDVCSLVPEHINNYFVRIIDILASVRSGYANHSTDVTAQDIKRATGYFDSILLHLLKERHDLIKFAGGFSQLQKLILQFNTVTLRENEVATSFDFSLEARHAQHVVPTVITKINAIHELLSVTTEQHAAYRRHNTSTDVVDLEHQQWWIQLRSYVVNLQLVLNTSSASIVPALTLLKSLRDFKECLTTMEETIVQNQQSKPSSSFLFEGLLTYVRGCAVSSRSIGAATAQAIDVRTIETDLQRICDKILLAGQNLQAVSRSAPTLAEDDAWFSKSSKARTKYLRAASIDSVISSLRNFIHKVQTSYADEDGRLESVATIYAPILQSYLEVCNRMKVDFESFHATTSKCTLLIGQNLDRLAKEGFCSPQPSEPEQSDSKATSDGTGLGEGGGAKDITKDIEDDEDLGDLEGIEDAQDNDDGEQDNEEAKEMEDDVGGDLEDVDGKSGSDEDDGAEESEDDEIEDEVGEVDDQDETALDEKMWNDEEEKDDIRDKDTKKDGKSHEDQKGDVDLVNKDQDKTEENTEKEKAKEENETEQEDDKAERNDEDNEMEPEIEEQDDGQEQQEPLVNTDTLELPEDMEMDDEDEKDEENPEEADTDAQENLSNSDESEENDVRENVEGVENEEGDEQAESEDDEAIKQDEEVQKDEEIQEKPADDEADIVPADEPDVEMLDNRSEEDDIGGEGPEHGGAEVNKGDAQQEENQSDSLEDNNDQADTKEGDIQMNDNAEGGDGGTTNSATTEPSAEANQNDREDLRSLGDALQQFRRILKIQDAVQPEDATEQSNGVDEVQDTKDTNQFEHIGDEQTADTQAMGPSTEETTAGNKQDDDEIMPELEDNKDENDANQIDATIEPEDATAVENGQIAADEGRMGDPVDATSRQKQAPLDDMDDDDIVDDLLAIPEISTFQEQQISTESVRLWQKHEQDTRDLANSLCEQLRLILEPTLATKMRGDFRTGKRLNMRRIIPYIASQFKKDKIWMRRSKPSKRQYQVMIAIDDSKSMAESSSTQLAFDTVALVSTALSVLEVGQIAVTKFGQRPEVVHSFQDQFSSESGAKIFDSFTFDQTKTDIRALLEQSLSLFTDARALQHNSGAELWQLQFIISDGICEDHESIKRLLRQAQEARIMVVFVVVDTIQGSKKHSILQMSQVKYVTGPDGSKKLQVQQYMEEFAFQNYLIIQNVAELPEMLSSTLRQFFAASQ